MSAYQTWDLTQSASRVQDVLGGLPLDPRRFRQEALNQFNDIAAGVEQENATADARNDQEVTSAFITSTDVMAQMNESANANLYISNALSKESWRVAKLNKDAKKGIYKVRQEYTYYAFMIEYYRFMTGIILYTLVVTLLLLMLTAAWRAGRVPQPLFMIVVGVLLVVYCLSMIVMFKNTAYRRKYQWNKYYWRPGTEIKNAVANANNASQYDSCPS